MPELTVYTSASDGYAYGRSNVSFQVAHDLDGYQIWHEQTGIIVGLSRDSLTWYIRRGFLFFDTSALPDGAVISAAILSINVYQHAVTGGDFDIIIQNGQPTYPHDPLEWGDYLYSYYSGDGGSINSSTLVNGAYNDITLNSDGRNWINKTGTTKICLRTSNDINQNDISISTASNFSFHTVEYGSAYRAKLVITYHVVPPTTTSQAITDINEITATGNGNITSIGGAAPTKRGVCWDTSPNPNVNDSKSEEIGSFGTGAFTRPMTGLIRGQIYYVKAYSYNIGGYGYGDEVNFYTYPSVTTYPPTDIKRADPTKITANGLIELDVVGNIITKRGFKYSETEEDPWDKSEPGTFGEGVFSLTIDTNLVADTIYFIRAYAEGPWDGAWYGSWVKFKTAYPYGTNKEEIRSEATASAADIKVVGGKRSLTIENHLIQNQTIADLISAAYLAEYKDQKTKLVVTKPTPPPYEIGDTVMKGAKGAKLSYRPAGTTLINYAAAVNAVHPYDIVARAMLIRKFNLSSAAVNYVGRITLEG